MHEFLQVGELKAQARRLLGYRTSLIMVIGVNVLLLTRIAFISIHPAQAECGLAHADIAFNAIDTRPNSLPLVTGEGDSASDGQVRRSGEAEHTGLSVLDHDSMASEDRPSASTEFEPSTDEADSALTIATGAKHESTFGAARVSTETAASHATIANWQNAAGQLAERWTDAAALAVRQLSARLAAERQPGARESHQPSSDPVVDLPTSQTMALQQHTAVSKYTVPESRPATQAAQLGLMIHNPLTNTESIYFLANGRVFELQPGESHQFPPQPQRIQFHRGGSLGNADRTLDAGVYHFAITDNGWDLVPLTDADKDVR